MPIAFDSIRRARPLLGTFVEIEVAAAAEPETAAAIDAAFDAVAEVHRLMSFHEHDSDVSRLNRDAGIRPTRVHAWTFQVLEAAVEMHRRSKGVFDVTIAPELQAMGLLPGLDGDPIIMPERRVIDPIELSPEQTVRLRSPAIAIDLGGIAKGFAVDRAIEVLRGFDIPGGLVNAGGDLRVFGQGSHTVHLRDPGDPLRLLACIELTDEALASTARRFDLVDGAAPGVSAIIDPFTGKPTGAVTGATVRAPSCMIADALTKVVMISWTGAGDLLAHYGASALLISVDGEVQITSDWPQAVHLAA
ncbi:FAD:protein FMN transferase [Bradyrhizobium sp. ISRA443]|uniref:FAD:protein FMN transferase n=1 Tax=unclassified Bradyrhizobium TaxID=2631580 RepID=UPI002478C329|nr:MULTISPECIES: FAD:protein FMN transferase [unclassified Bradyrhizobium]WGR99518.1 FAD:protein FMN transferase [Bradyrhizobium sp. ISRA436]WGS06408.1 FAD:protein FMN transferase [Bradyrhizobium sp. ISRA437]WGS13292.1 FAD:protein FMN transferase [Bradyrhizobium sp. ISRA443]